MTTASVNEEQFRSEATELFERALRVHGRDIGPLLSQCARCDRVVKGAMPGDPWAETTALALALAGVGDRHRAPRGRAA